MAPRRSPRKRAEATPAPSSPAAPASDKGSEPATKKRRASPATKADAKKRKRNTDTPDTSDVPDVPDEKPAEPEEKPKKPAKSTGKKTTTAKADTKDTKAKAKAKTKVTKEDSKTVKAKTKDPKTDSKVTKKATKDTKKSTKDTKKQIEESEKATSHGSESESNVESKAANSPYVKQESPDTTPFPSGVSAVVSTDAEGDDKKKIKIEQDADDKKQIKVEQDADTVPEDESCDNIGTQIVSPLPLPSDGGDTELETDVKLSMESRKSTEQRKAREAGDTPYQDHTLHPNTMLFLQDLKENNNREWLRESFLDYQEAKKDWETFIETLTKKLSEKDSTLPELPASEVVVRIQKDNRSSKDQVIPYKPYFSAVWSRSAKEGHHASYCIRLEPGSCYVGSGFSCPGFSSQDQLALIRADIDRNSHRLKDILSEPDMRREFLGGVSDEEDEVVKAFISLPQNKETAMRSHPKGYEKDNENIQLLRLRSFNIGKQLPDAAFLEDDAQDKIAALIGVMEPFVSYLNSVIKPDPTDSEAPEQSQQ